MPLKAGEICAAVFLGINSVLDIRKRRISLVSAAAAGVLGTILNIYAGSFPGDILLAVFPGLLLVLLSFISQGAVGMGDGIAAAAAGILIPPAEIIAGCCAGSIFAAVFAGAIWVKKRHGRDDLPFIPFLTAGYAAVLLIKVTGR